MQHLHPIEQRVLSAINDDGLLKALADLVSIPSLDGTTAENEAQEAVAALLQSQSMTVDRWEIDLPVCMLILIAVGKCRVSERSASSEFWVRIAVDVA